MAGEPQKSQRCATRPSTKTEMAWQLWHMTSRRAVPQPRPLAGLASAAARSCSTMGAAPSPACGAAWATVPQ